MRTLLTTMQVSLIAVLLNLGGFVVGQNQPDEIIVGLSADVDTWHPARTVGSITTGVVENIYEKLVEFDAMARPVPGLAESWETVAEDAWDFHIRQGVQFTNGEPVDAQAAKKSLDILRTDPLNNDASWLSSIVETEVVDEFTLRIHTDGPAPELVDQLAWAGYVLPPEHAFDGDTYSDALVSEPVGTGPYVLSVWQRGSRIVLERNDDWWGGAPDIRRVEIRVMPEAVTRTAALLTDEVDLIDNPNPEDIPRLQNADGIEVQVSGSQRVAYIFLDSYREMGGPLPEGSPGLPAGEPNPLQDVRVRKAIYQAIDREAIASILHEGLVVPAYQIMMPSSYAYSDTVDELGYDPAAARELLDQANYPEGFEVELITLDGRLPKDSDTMLFIASQLADIGIKAEIRALSQTVASPLYAAHEVTGGLQSWGALTMPGMSWEGIAYGNTETGEWGRQNHGRFSSPTINALLDELRNENDRGNREQLFDQLAQAFMDEIPVIPVFYATNIRAIDDRFVHNTDGLEFIHYKNIEIR